MAMRCVPCTREEESEMIRGEEGESKLERERANQWSKIQKRRLLVMTEFEKEIDFL